MAKHIDESTKEFIRYCIEYRKFSQQQTADLAKVSRSTVNRVLMEPAPENRHIDTRQELKAALAGIDATITLARQEPEPDLRLIGGLYDSKAKLLLKLEEAESKASPNSGGNPFANSLATRYFPIMPIAPEGHPSASIPHSPPPEKRHDPSNPTPKDGPSKLVRDFIERSTATN
jgi:transcriptional regulator with XRE-family HTH domain